VLSAAAALVRPKVDLVLKHEWEEFGEQDPDISTAEQIVESKIRKAAS